jgi:hypothetical protein
MSTFGHHNPHFIRVITDTLDGFGTEFGDFSTVSRTVDGIGDGLKI